MQLTKNLNTYEFMRLAAIPPTRTERISRHSPLIDFLLSTSVIVSKSAAASHKSYNKVVSKFEEDVD